MKNEKSHWCAICEVKIHATTDYHLNLKNQHNYHAVYQTNVVVQNNNANILRNNKEENEQSNQIYEG